MITKKKNKITRQATLGIVTCLVLTQYAYANEPILSTSSTEEAPSKFHHLLTTDHKIKPLNCSFKQQYLYVYPEITDGSLINNNDIKLFITPYLSDPQLPPPSESYIWNDHFFIIRSDNPMRSQATAKINSGLEILTNTSMQTFRWDANTVYPSCKWDTLTNNLPLITSAIGILVFLCLISSECCTQHLVGKIKVNGKTPQHPDNERIRINMRQYYELTQQPTAIRLAESHLRIYYLDKSLSLQKVPQNALYTIYTTKNKKWNCVAASALGQHLSKRNSFVTVLLIDCPTELPDGILKLNNNRHTFILSTINHRPNISQQDIIKIFDDTVINLEDHERKHHSHPSKHDRPSYYKKRLDKKTEKARKTRVRHEKEQLKKVKQSQLCSAAKTFNCKETIFDRVFATYHNETIYDEHKSLQENKGRMATSITQTLADNFEQIKNDINFIHVKQDDRWSSIIGALIKNHNRQFHINFTEASSRYNKSVLPLIQKIIKTFNDTLSDSENFDFRSDNDNTSTTEPLTENELLDSIKNNTNHTRQRIKNLFSPLIKYKKRQKSNRTSKLRNTWSNLLESCTKLEQASTTDTNPHIRNSR